MYFKILADDLTHHGFTYTTGLNIDIKPFSPIPRCNGGLFFADEKNILEFCNYGTKIAEVTLPKGEMIVQVGKKYKAHSIILGKIYNLWTIETFEWLLRCGVNLHAKNDYALRWAAENGHLEVVKCLVEHGADIHAYNEEALRFAASQGFLEVVEYLIDKGADIHAYDDCTLRLAAVNGHLDVVEYLGSLERDN